MEYLLAISVLPSILLGSYIYKKDVTSKEPTGLLVGLFFAGVLSLIPAAILETIAEALFPSLFDGSDLFLLFIGCSLGIGLIEEGVKWLFLNVITWKHKDFDHIYDAIVYAVFVSLGFATVENILYVFQYGFLTALVRAVASVPGHVFFAVFMGYYYGIAKQASVNSRKNLVTKNMLLSICIPTLAHGFFDFCLFAQTVPTIIAYLVFLVFLYILAFKKVKQLSNIKVNLNNVPVSSTPMVAQAVIPSRNYYCSNCGRPAIGNFCAYCGNKIN